MQRVGTKLTFSVLVASALSLLGCGGPNAVTLPVQMVLDNTVTKAEVVQAAESVLTRMHFSIEKLDAQQGLVRTRPLRGAQFFEFWRSDNVGAYAGTEAGVQSLRRTVELRVRSEGRGQRTEDGSDTRLCVECAVAVQRLSLPPSEVTGVSAAYGIYTRSTPAVQRIDVRRRQQRDMAWIDLGEDQRLAARILERLDKTLRHTD